MRKSNNDVYEIYRLLRESEQIKVDADIDTNDNKNKDAVPYTQQDTLMTNTLSSAKQEFGADFNNIKNPMLYYPNDGDITLSGIIPEMNDAKFQFRYKVGDGAGCYIWSNPYMPISDKTIQLLSKVNGVCKNWRDEISKSEDSRPSNYHDDEDVQQNQQGQVNQQAEQAEEQEQQQEDQANQMNGQADAINNLANALGGGDQQNMQERWLRRGDDILFENRYFRSIHPGDDLD